MARLHARYRPPTRRDKIMAEYRVLRDKRNNRSGMTKDEEDMLLQVCGIERRDEILKAKTEHAEFMQRIAGNSEYHRRMDAMYSHLVSSKVERTCTKKIIKVVVFDGLLRVAWVLFFVCLALLAYKYL